MITNSQLLGLLLLVCCAYSQPGYKQVNLIYQELPIIQEFSQADLQAKAQTVVDWGNPADYFISCSGLNNSYYDIIFHTQTIQKTFNNFGEHHGLKVSFDYVFLNIEKIYGGVEKNASLKIDGNSYDFNAIVNNDYYSCIPKATSSKRDGKGSTTLTIGHSNPNPTFSITPTNLGTVARLGVANMQILRIKCGLNSHFNANNGSCECDNGFLAADVIDETQLTTFHKCIRIL